MYALLFCYMQLSFHPSKARVTSNRESQAPKKHATNKDAFKTRGLRIHSPGYGLQQIQSTECHSSALKIFPVVQVFPVALKLFPIVQEVSPVVQTIFPVVQEVFPIVQEVFPIVQEVFAIVQGACPGRFLLTQS